MLQYKERMQRRQLKRLLAPHTESLQQKAKERSMFQES